MVTKEEMLEALPAHMRRTMNDASYMNLCAALTDRDELQRFKENFVSFSTALIGGKYSVQQYMDAVMYVSFKKMGLTNLASFKRTFPVKMKRYYAEGKSDASINALVCGYNTTKLVTKIFDQSMIPVHILNADAVQEAINAQLKILRTSKNELAITKAADSLLNHLKPPVESKVTLDIGIAETPMLREVKVETERLAQQQLDMIKNGLYTAKQVAEMRVVGEAEYVEH